MATIIGGSETGLQNSSLALLARNDKLVGNSGGNGEKVFFNASNGNMVVTHQDAWLPSLGDDYALVRTYNLRGQVDGDPSIPGRWRLSSTVQLSALDDGGTTYFEVTYGDGSVYEYRYDATRGLYVSKDGAGAFGTIEDLGAGNDPRYILTRADNSQLTFDSNGRLVRLENANGVAIDYIYNGSDQLTQVIDDQGHVISYTYQNGLLDQVTDENANVLAQYNYDGNGRLEEVIDRAGHSTQYTYTGDGRLQSIILPDTQQVDGQTETYDTRQLSFAYGADGDITFTDAMGNMTTIDIDYTPGQAGSTTVLDALGYNRAFSNDTLYSDWRIANSYYASYDSAQAATDPNYQAQVDAIKNAHSIIYHYRADGYITSVVDQHGMQTHYSYDSDDNLTAVTDANGWGAVHSDSDYYRSMRAELGVTDTGGNGKLVTELTQSEIDELTEAFTRHYEYDSRGNLTKAVDNADNITTFTYTDENRISTSTSAIGNALVQSDDQHHQDRRVELGYAALVQDLSSDDILAILDLHTTVFEYDTSGNLEERRDAGGDITRFEYDPSGNGNLTKRIVFLDATDLTDPAKQQVTTYAYDGFGNRTSTTDAESNQTHSQYDHFGNLTRFTDAKDRETHYTYDDDNRLLTVTDAEGHTTVNTYDAVGNRISVTDANSHTVTRIYNLNNQLIATIDPSESNPADDRTTSFEYDVVGNNTAVVDAEDNRTVYSYDVQHRLVRVLGAQVLDADNQQVQYTTEYTYDAVGNRISVTDANEHTSQVLYTNDNLVSERIDATGHVTRFEYDANGNNIKIIAGYQLPPERRQIVSFAYDEEDQLITSTDAEGNVTTLAYDAPGNLVATADANGRAMSSSDDSYYRDLRGQLGYVDGSGQGRLAADLTASEVEEILERYTTRYEYDGNNRLVREILPEVVDPTTGQPVRNTIEHLYDENGNEYETIDAGRNSTRFTFDRDNRVTMVEDANGIKTVFAYDSRHNRTAVMIGIEATADANGHITITNADQAQITRFGYDEFNQLIFQTDAMGNALVESNAELYQQLRTELGYAALTADLTAEDIQALRELYTKHYAYDKMGNRISVVDHLDRTTDMDYDALNRLTTTTDALTQTTAFAYDGNGNLLKQTDAPGTVDERTTTFEYDAMNRLTVTTAAGATALETVALNEYDAFGNLERTTRAFGTSDARTTHFEYDLANRLIKNIDAETNSQSYEYDAVGNRIRVTDGRLNTTRYVYDAQNRKVRIIDPLSFETRFEYDAVGNRLSIIDAKGAFTRFDYDPGNRLFKTTDAEDRVTTYVYDVRGNTIEQRTAVGTDDEQLTVFAYDASNNLVKVTDDQNKETTHDYDRAYNLTRTTDANGNTTTSAFDALNRMISVTDAEGQLTTYQYDAKGNLLLQVNANGHAAATSDDAHYRAIRQENGIVDANGDGKLAADLTEAEIQQLKDLYTTRYEYDDLDRVIIQTHTDGVQTHFGYDRVGNRTTITHAANTADAVVETFEYDQADRLVLQIDGEGNALVTSNEQVYQDKRVGLGYAALAENLSGTDVQALLDLHTTRYVYDENHNRTELTDARGNTTVYSYDANNRLHTITDPEENVVEYRYDGNGNRTEVIDAELNRTTTYYNANNEVSLSVDAEGYATAYKYDDNGNLDSMTLYMQALALPMDPTVEPVPVTSAGDQTTTFEYDGVNRLVAQIDAEGYRTEFVYDAVGNRLAVVGPNADAATRLNSDHFRALRRDQGIVDANGEGKLAEDLTAGEIDQLKDLFTNRSYFDAANREVKQVSAEGYLVEVDYDALGNSISRTVYDQRVEIPDVGQPVPVTGDSGRRTSMAYDRANRLVKQTSPLLVDTVHEYDSHGNRTAVIEAAGTADERRTRYTYDAADRVIESIDALDNITRLTLDGNGNVVSQTDAYGTVDERTTTFIYDNNNRVARQTNDLGVITTMVYDGNGNVTRRTMAEGLPEVRSETFVYDGNNRLVAHENGEFERTETEYDGAGNRIRLTVAPGLAEERTNWFEFDRDNRLVASVDGELFRTEYRYDGTGNKIETIQAVGVIDEQRHSYYQYDADDRLTQITDPMGGVTRYTYDVLGNQTQIIDSNGGVQDNTFDILGRMLKSESAGDILTENTYDLRGNITSTTQSWVDGGDSRTTTYGYDTLDRQVLVTDPEGFSTTIEYDAFGNQTMITHGQYLLVDGDDGYDVDKPSRAFVQTNRFTFDSADRMLTMEDAVGNITTYGYNAVGDRTSMADGNADAMIISDDPYYRDWRKAMGYVDVNGDGKLAGDLTQAEAEALMAAFTTHYDYDDAGRVIETRTPEGGIAQNIYDDAGNLIQERKLQSDDGTDQVWTTTTYEYDDNARLTAQIDDYLSRTEYEYDAMGNRTLVRAAAGTTDERTTRSEYDLNNRVNAEIDALENRTEYEYDAMGNRIKVTDALNRVAHYYFDDANNLEYVLDPQGYITFYDYDAAGNRTQETTYMTAYTGSVDDLVAPIPTASVLDRTTLSQYDGNGRIIQKSTTDGSVHTSIYQRVTDYTYDAAGNLKTQVQSADTTELFTLQYEYDLNNRLKKFTDVDGTETAFTYDQANNKTGETITTANPNDPNTVRKTTYGYDRNNRQVLQVFDPDGLNLKQSTDYDRLGNAVAQTNANGHTMHTEYDLNNRAVRTIDPLENDTVTTYDAVGNAIAVQDARGNIIDKVYDDNNRLVQELLPDVEIYTIDGGVQTTRPTISHTYDAVGNEVQTVDAAGFVTTRYYDGNNRLEAEINGDNVLRRYTYNAAGDTVTETLYMTRLDPAAHDYNVRPIAPTGEVRTITTAHDLAGRATSITYPAIEVTALSGTETDDPSASVSMVQPEERNVYDSFGNLIESFDKNDNRIVYYYDIKGRVIAQVDREGYLIEYDYDAQDNVVEQRVYTDALETASIDPNVRPNAPATGEVYQSSRIYDAANRMIKDCSPMVQVYDHTQADPVANPIYERVITRYTYDGANNQTSRTLAAGSSQAYTEYMYYDGLNRQVAVIDGNRVVNFFGYDANGNQTMTKRYFKSVDSAIDLATLEGGTDFAILVGDDENDQQIDRVYDALNRLTSETDLMGTGSSDDLTKAFGYDANGKVTRAEDEDGFVQQMSYDANGNILRLINDDGGGMEYEYDAAGSRIYVATDQIHGWRDPVNTISASVGEAITISWGLDADTSVESYVVYDTVSHGGILSYSGQTAMQATWESDSGAVQIPLDGMNGDDSVYFRVVTLDASGNLAWTSERMLVLPPRLVDLTVATMAYDSIEVDTAFEGAVINPQLWYGAAGATTSAVVLTDQGGGTYRATLTGLADIQALSYRISWEDADGNTYEILENTFEADGGHSGTASDVSWLSPVVGSDRIVIVNGVRMDSNLSDGRLIVDPGLTASSSAGYDVYYGTETTLDHTTGITSSPVYSFDLDITADLTPTQAAAASGGLHLAWGAAGQGYANDVVMAANGITPGTTLPGADNINFSQVLSEVESELRALTNPVPQYYNDRRGVFDGENWSLPPRWESTAGTGGERSGSSWRIYEQVSDGESSSYQWVYYSYRELTEPRYTGSQKEVIQQRANDLGVSYAYWGDDLLSHPDALRQLMIDMGYSTKLQAHAIDPNYNLDTHHFNTDQTWTSGQYDLKVYYLDGQGQEVVVHELQNYTAQSGTVTGTPSFRIEGSQQPGQLYDGLEVTVDLTATEMAVVGGDIRATWGLADGDFTHDAALSPDGTFTGSNLPAADNINFTAVLSEVETELRAVTHIESEYLAGDDGEGGGVWTPTEGSGGYYGDDGEGNYGWFVDTGEGYVLHSYRELTVNDYTGTQKEVIQQRAADLGVSYAYWGDPLTDHPVELRQLMIDMGYSAKLHAAALDSNYNDFHRFTLGENLSPGLYDLKVFYHDTQGREVIVDILRVDTAQAITSSSGRSLAVEASEIDGTITRAADGIYSVDPGLYAGPSDFTISDHVAALSTASAYGGSRSAGTAFRVENHYNALGVQVATNAENGQWMEFGVDANGNVLATRNYGLDRDDDPITTYTAFDGLNQEVAKFGAFVDVHGESSPQRIVTRIKYDAVGNIIEETDALKQTIKRDWNALGLQTGETDQLGNASLFYCDRLGRRTMETDGNGHSRYEYYDTMGNRVQSVDAEGNTTDYTFDVFGRNTQITNAISDSMSMQYDHRDRLASAEDAVGNTTVYTYDGRNNRTGASPLLADHEKVDLPQAVGQLEAQLRLITHEESQYAYTADWESFTWLPTEGSGGTLTDDGEGNIVWRMPDGESSYVDYAHAMNTVNTYTGSQEAVIRQRADDLGVTYAYWGDPLMSHPAELYALLVDMGYSDILTLAALGDHAPRQVYNVNGQVVDTITYQDGQEIHEIRQYDAYGNMEAETDGEGRITTRVYGEFNRLTQIIDPAGRLTTFEYDDYGNVTREYRPASGKDIRRTYDDAGRLLEVNDLGTGVRTVYTYDIAGNRMTETVTTSGDAHNRSISYQYDAVGQMVRWADGVTGMNTNYEWDGAGNLRRTYTDAGYDPLGANANLESVLTQVESELRAQQRYGTYSVWGEDGEGNLVFSTYTGFHYPPGTWSQNQVMRAAAGDRGVDLAVYDAVLGYGLEEYEDGEGNIINDDGEGNINGNYMWVKNLLDHKDVLKRLLIDMGYGDRVAAAQIDPAYRYMDHVYTYDDNDRLLTISENGTDIEEHQYDAVGNRIMDSYNGTATWFEFDGNGRVTSARSNGILTADWVYNAKGNVTRFRQYNGSGNVRETTTKSYYENNRLYLSEYTDHFDNDKNQETTMTMDRSGRLLSTHSVGDNIYNYTHGYNAAGLETHITASGDASGTTVKSYDANDQLISVNKGDGDATVRSEILQFVYNNDGQILYRFHDTGAWERADSSLPSPWSGYERSVEDTQIKDITHAEYAYANGNPVGREDRTTEKHHIPVLDNGAYRLVQPLSEDLPQSAVTSYTARFGDTLQSIAATVYGNSSLWFVLAEANGLGLDDAIAEGQHIEIPNNIKSGRLTADTHVVYDASEIIGSTMPNLNGPDKDTCVQYVMMVIVVVIAIAVSYATNGAAAKLSAALINWGVNQAAAGFLALVIAGVVVSAAGSIVQQAIFMALGYQDEFNWASVAEAAIQGLASGVAKGMSVSGILSEVAQYSRVAAAAINVAANAVQQILTDGQITSWTSLAASAINGYSAGGKASDPGEALGGMPDSYNDWDESMDFVDKAKDLYNKGKEFYDNHKQHIKYIKPWVNLATKYVKNDGELDALDWADAVGETLGAAVTNPNAPPNGIENTTKRIAVNVLVSGALSNVDKKAGQNYLMNVLGNEVNQFIGHAATGFIDRLAEDYRQRRYESAMAEAMPDSYDDWDGASLMAAPRPEDHQWVDDLANFRVPDIYEDYGFLANSGDLTPSVNTASSALYNPSAASSLSGSISPDLTQAAIEMGDIEFITEAGRLLGSIEPNVLDGKNLRIVSDAVFKANQYNKDTLATIPFVKQMIQYNSGISSIDDVVNYFQKQFSAIGIEEPSDVRGRTLLCTQHSGSVEARNIMKLLGSGYQQYIESTPEARDRLLWKFANVLPGQYVDITDDIILSDTLAEMRRNGDLAEWDRDLLSIDVNTSPQAMQIQLEAAAYYKLMLRPRMVDYYQFTDDFSSSRQKWDAGGRLAIEAALTFGPFVGKYGKPAINALRRAGIRGAEHLGSLRIDHSALRLNSGLPIRRITPNRPGGYISGDVDLHGNLSPGANRARGHRNMFEDNYVQSHHPIQDKWARKWAKKNGKDYNTNKASAVLLESSSGKPHAKISGAQRARRRAGGYDTSIKHEFNVSYKEMIDAGVGVKTARKAFKDAYKYFDGLGAFE